MVSQLDVGRDLKRLPLGMTRGGDSRLIVSGFLVSINATTNRAVVAINGGAGSSMPFLGAAGDYIVGEVVFVSRNPAIPGGDLKCLGPVGGTSPEEVPPSAGGAPPTTRTETVTIVPNWSGTWRADRSAYDRWNVSRSDYGGRSTLYQGSAYGSGSLTGLAVYGDKIVNLNATAISSMTVTLRGANLSLASYPAIQIQGSTNGTQPAGAPSVAGSTFTGSPGRSGVVTVTIDATVREAFRVGTYKGFAVNGASYNAVRGTSAADGMALTITYTKDI